MATTSVVNVDDAFVAYQLHGRGPAVVLVNGPAALDAHWDPVIAELSSLKIVISLDYSGTADTTDDGSAPTLQKLMVKWNTEIEFCRSPNVPGIRK